MRASTVVPTAPRGYLVLRRRTFIALLMKVAYNIQQLLSACDLSILCAFLIWNARYVSRFTLLPAHG